MHPQLQDTSLSLRPPPAVVNMSGTQISHRSIRERFREAKRRLKNCLRRTSESPGVIQAFVEMGIQLPNPGIEDSTLGRLLAASRVPPFRASSTSLRTTVPVLAKETSPDDRSAIGKPSMANYGHVDQQVLLTKSTSQPEPSRSSRVKDRAGVAWSFTQLLLKKAPVAIDTNPVKVAFGIAQIALELKKGMQDNMDATERRIASSSDLFCEVNKALEAWHEKSRDETRAMEAFKSKLGEEIKKFSDIQGQSAVRRFLIQDEDKQRIADIFERINEAREQLILATGIRVHRITVAVDQKLNRLLREQLKPSRMANYKFYLEGEHAKVMRRAICTPGTRRRILWAIKTWACESSHIHSVYWLFGPAGTGKSTIACTIVQLFEFAFGPDDNLVLGANFFCSRQSEETRCVTRVVRTIAYQLALVCKAFADAYAEHGDDSTIDQSPVAQLESLLVKPWNESHAVRVANKDPTYIVGIDALDELEGKGGSKFLRALLNVQGKLQGLKFFITSRGSPELVDHAKSLGDGQICRLEEVSREEADADIKTYLLERLGFASEEEIQQVVRDAAGLFIYAATVVEHVGAAWRPEAEQKKLLKRLLAVSTSTTPQSRSFNATATLDKLYHQILEEALHSEDPEQDLFRNRLNILHTFLCTVERTTTSIVTQLVHHSPDEDIPVNGMSTTTNAEEIPDDSVANDVLQGLHAVLYSQGGLVMWYHKSFPDFVFDQKRSHRFYCNERFRNYFLAGGCLKIMQQELRFNIADIQDSSTLDQHNPTLQAMVERNISPVLRYTCQTWSEHLVGAPWSQHLGGALMPDSARVLQSIHDFLQLRVLFWMEVMNLLGQQGRCDTMLRDAQPWVAQYQDMVELAQDLGCAAVFAVHFSASRATASTPHLYLSALATFPHPIRLRERWRRQFGGIPIFTNVVRESGRSPSMSIKLRSWVMVVAVSSNGCWILTGEEDGIVRLWELSTGEELKAYEGHNGMVHSVAFSPDDTRVASGSFDRTVHVWDASSGERLMVLEGHSRRVKSVVFSPAGTHIVSGSADSSLRVWDALSGKLLKVLEGHNDWIHAVAFTHSGTRIVSGSGDRSVRVWDVISGVELKVLEGHTGSIQALDFSPDDTRIVSGGRDTTLRVWDAFSGEQLNVFKGHTDWIKSVAWSPTGTHVVSGSADNSIRIWDASNGEQLDILECHTDWVNSVVWLPNSTRIISGSTDKSVQVWDPFSGEESRAVKGRSGRVTSVACSLDGTRIVSGSEDRSVRLWDALSGKELLILEGHTDFVSSVTFLSDRRIVSGSHDKSVRIWDISSGDELGLLEGHGGWVTSVACSSDGTRIVSGSRDESVRVWDASNGEELTVIKGHDNWVTAVAFSADGARILSGSADKSARVWNALSWEEMMTLNGHIDQVTSVAFSLAGTRISSGSCDESVRVWDALSGDELMMIESQGQSQVSSVAFSLDGTQMISGCGGGSVRIWDASNGEEIRVLCGHTAAVNSVVYSPVGNHVVSGSSDRSVRVWRAPSQSGDRYIQERGPEGYTGWLVSPSNPSAYLMFVPLSEELPDDSNILTMPHHLVSHIDFSKAKLGREWTLCFTPVFGE